MKQQIIAAVASIALIVPATSFAQNAFKGFYAQIATGYQTTKFGSSTEPVVTPAGVQVGSLSTQSFNVSTVPAILGLGYLFAVDAKWMLGVGFDYDLVSKQTSFGVTLNRPAYPPAYGNPAMKVNNRWNLFIAPGYLVSDTGLLYGKVGYASAKADADGAVSDSSANLNGYQLGLGYRAVLSGNFFGFIEGNYMKYNSPTFDLLINNGPFTASPQVSASAYNALVGVGLKF